MRIKGKEASADKVEKLFCVGEKKEYSEAEGTVVAWGSKPVVDRDRELITGEAWNVEQFMKNPVLMLCHDYSKPPVGKVLWAKATKDGLKFKARFANTAVGREIHELYKDGIMNAFSVGFAPKSWRDVPNAKAGDPRKIFDRVELLEISCVPIPCCPDALVELYSKGMIKSPELNTVVKGFVDDIEAKGGPGSGVRGHTTADDGGGGDKKHSAAEVQQFILGKGNKEVHAEGKARKDWSQMAEGGNKLAMYRIKNGDKFAVVSPSASMRADLFGKYKLDKNSSTGTGIEPNAYDGKDFFDTAKDAFDAGEAHVKGKKKEISDDELQAAIRKELTDAFADKADEIVLKDMEAQLEAAAEEEGVTGSTGFNDHGSSDTKGETGHVAGISDEESAGEENTEIEKEIQAEEELGDGTLDDETEYDDDETGEFIDDASEEEVVDDKSIDEDIHQKLLSPGGQLSVADISRAIDNYFSDTRVSGVSMYVADLFPYNYPNGAVVVMRCEYSGEDAVAGPSEPVNPVQPISFIYDYSINPYTKDVLLSNPVEVDQQWMPKYNTMAKAITDMAESIIEMKIGRVLSGKNRTLIENCSNQMSEAVTALNELLAATTTDSAESKSVDDEEEVVAEVIPVELVVKAIQEAFEKAKTEDLNTVDALRQELLSIDVKELVGGSDTKPIKVKPGQVVIG